MRHENLFAGVTDETIHAASALLVQGEDKTVRQSLGKRYRELDLSAALVYATACARAGDSETVREILTLLAEVLVSGEGPPGLSQLSRQDRLAATAALVQIGSESWKRFEFPNAMHAYAVGAHLVEDDPRPHYNLGLAWERVGDFREALEAFRRTLELDPNFPRAREHHAALMRKTGIDPERQ